VTVSDARRPRVHRLGQALAGLAVALAAGCAVRPPTPELARVEPDSGYRLNLRQARPDNDPQTLFILTFSGGGTRAAAFAYGVLEELRRTSVRSPRGAHAMLSEIDLITGTSGGSFTALAFALDGERLFERYEQAFLKRDVEAALLERLFDPLRWPQVLSQGFGRSELAEEYYDEILFHRATFGDLLGRPAPAAIVGATDVTTGARFDFSQPQFDVICADLSRFRLSRAAAASAAVPVVLSPVTLDNRGGSCGYRPPQWMAGALDASRDRFLGNRADLRIRQMELLADGRRRPYIHLVDGGLSDNLGLYGVVEALQELMDNPAYRAAMGAGGLRRIAIVVVNARSAPNLGFDQVPYGPGTFALLMQSISVPMNSYSTESVAALRDVITEWRLRERLQADARLLGEGGAAAAEVPPVEFTVIDVSFDAVADSHLREYLQNLPTTFALPDEAVDRLRATAAALLRDSPAFRQLVDALAGQP
jgi:NTE family protein